MEWIFSFDNIRFKLCQLFSSFNTGSIKRIHYKKKKIFFEKFSIVFVTLAENKVALPISVDIYLLL